MTTLAYVHTLRMMRNNALAWKDFHKSESSITRAQGETALRTAIYHRQALKGERLVRSRIRAFGRESIEQDNLQ